MLMPPSVDQTVELLRQKLEQSVLRPLKIAGRELLPIVQGGMGVGISAHRLAGSGGRAGRAWARCRSVDLRRHHPDLMERTQRCRRAPAARPTSRPIDAANLEALDARDRAPRAQLAAGRGLLAINVMRAVSEYAAVGQARARSRHRRGRRRRRPAAGPARPGRRTTRRRC
ncbi:MAG: hypothetical protein MZW92_41920 [Comamonadaceae bacterium]|nr:hypothetical protein [Comamonadaceae bacterium]